MSARTTFRFWRALLATNLKASFALRGAFWIAAGAMVLNNLLFFTMWWIFFARFEEVGGWRIGDMMALYGVVAAGFGCAVVFAGGVRELSRYISEGDLDGFLCQPKPPLLHALGSATFAAGWGDLASGLLLVTLSGLLRLETVPLLLVAVLISSVVFTASGVLLHSMAFWVGRVESLARQLWEFLITFSLYPRPLFSGALKLMLFTVVPAGFIGFLPVELLRAFSWSGLAAALAGAVLYSVLAALVFAAGLRRYESGNRIGVRV